jgi:hypothetical protein
MSGTVLRPDVEHTPTFKPGDRVVVTEGGLPALVGTQHVVADVEDGYVWTPGDKDVFDVEYLTHAVPVHESFHNVYAERTGNMRVSRRAADKNADPDRLAVVHIRLWADGAVTADVEQVTT